MNEPQFEYLSDREILILTCRKTFENSERLDAHSKRIKSLEMSKNYLAGGIAAILALLGIKWHG